MGRTGCEEPSYWALLLELRVHEEEAAEASDHSFALPTVEWTMCRVIDCPGLPQSTLEVLGQQLAAGGEAATLDTSEVFGSEPANAHFTGSVSPGSGRQD